MPLDGSKFCEAVIKPLAALATGNDAEIHILAVVSSEKSHTTWAGVYAPEAASSLSLEAATSMHSRMGGPSHPPVVETSEQNLDREVQTARDYISIIASKFEQIKTTVDVVVGENVAEEIKSYADREEIDVIAMTTHGRTGLSRILMGSVAMDLLKLKATPLLLVRPDELR